MLQSGEEFSAWSNVKEDERHVKDKFPDFYFNPEDHEKPPPEVSTSLLIADNFFSIKGRAHV